MTWQIPWVISGISELPLDIARVMAYAATGGGEGIINATDLQVKALPTPGTSVTVGSGAFACLNRFGASVPQTYIGYNVGDDTVSIAAQGAGTRYDLVYAHITDPGQPGNPATPAAVETRVIQNVASTVKKLSDVPGYAGKSGLALALIAIPPSTSIITQLMITDLRQLVAQKRESYLRILSLDGASTPNQAFNTTGIWNTFPDQATWPIEIPSWATNMIISATANAVRAEGTTGGEWTGYARVRVGASTVSGNTYINSGINAGTVDTISYAMGTEKVIPTAMRGTTQTFLIENYKIGGSNATLWARAGTVVILNVLFFNRAETTA